MPALPTNAPTSELQECVDQPSETLDREYKSWLDLSAQSAAARADVARHIAALANYGGGRLIFGFTDTLDFAGPNPFTTTAIDRDLISGIVKRYLEPPFQCDARVVKSAAGNDHPIVTVPSHGATPICAKASGPIVDGKAQGISQGVHYVRKPGPESAPIVTSAEWAPIIRRCALHERSAILGAIDLALRGARELSAVAEDLLAKWHNAAHEMFLRDVAERRPSSDVGKRHWQFSFAIERADNQRLDPGQLPEVVRLVNSEVRDTVRSGLSMFYPYTRPGIEAYFQTDETSGQGNEDFLECTMLRDPTPAFPAVDMWRLAADGHATLIRPYWEDDADPRSTNRARGTWFSPRLLAQMLAEFIRHARGVSERFESPVMVSFRCEWFGLSGRQRWDPWGLWFPDAGTAHNDHRISTGSWPVGALTNSWPEIVARLGAPVLRVFGTDWVMTADWVRGQSASWLR